MFGPSVAGIEIDNITCRENTKSVTVGITTILFLVSIGSWYYDVAGLPLSRPAPARLVRF